MCKKPAIKLKLIVKSRLREKIIAINTGTYRAVVIVTGHFRPNKSGILAMNNPPTISPR